MDVIHKKSDSPAVREPQSKIKNTLTLITQKISQKQKSHLLRWLFLSDITGIALYATHSTKALNERTSHTRVRDHRFEITSFEFQFAGGKGQT